MSKRQIQALVNGILIGVGINNLSGALMKPDWPQAALWFGMLALGTTLQFRLSRKPRIFSVTPGRAPRRSVLVLALSWSRNPIPSFVNLTGDLTASPAARSPAASSPPS